MSKTINDNEVKTLKAILLEKDMTQEALARKLNVSLNSVNSWVTGRKIPRFDNVCQMANELEVSLKTIAKAFHFDVTHIPDDKPTK